MFEIYLTKDAQNAMTREEAYVLTQSMRIFNSIRMFILIAEDIKKLGLDDNVSNKKYTELLMYQAANLNEVLVTLREDLIERYRAMLKDENILNTLDSWEKRIKSNDQSLRVLEAVRNKYAFHVPYDAFYVWNYITDDPVKEDKLIGIGETIQGSGWFFTWDFELIMSYLKDHVLEKDIELKDVYPKTKDIIDQISIELYRLFNAILQDILRNKIYCKGEKRTGAEQEGPTNGNTGK